MGATCCKGDSEARMLGEADGEKKVMPMAAENQFPKDGGLPSEFGGQYESCVEATDKKSDGLVTECKGAEESPPCTMGGDEPKVVVPVEEPVNELASKVAKDSASKSMKEPSSKTTNDDGLSAEEKKLAKEAKAKAKEEKLAQKNRQDAMRRAQEDAIALIPCPATRAQLEGELKAQTRAASESKRTSERNSKNSGGIAATAAAAVAAAAVEANAQEGGYEEVPEEKAYKSERDQDEDYDSEEGGYEEVRMDSKGNPLSLVVDPNARTEEKVGISLKGKKKIPLKGAKPAGPPADDDRTKSKDGAPTPAKAMMSWRKKAAREREAEKKEKAESKQSPGG